MLSSITECCRSATYDFLGVKTRVLWWIDGIRHRNSHAIEKLSCKFIAVYNLVHAPVDLGLFADIQVEYVVVSVLHWIGDRYSLTFDQDSFA